MARKEPDKEPLPSPKGTLSRRGFLIGGAAAAAGAAYVLSGRKGDVSAGDGRYISIEEAKELYLDLKNQVEKKWQEAKAAGKPLRIFVLEGHTSADSLAYELMLMDIAKKLGINDLLVEQSDHTLNLMRDPRNRGLFEFEHKGAGRHLEAIVAEAQRVKMKLVGIDNLWPTAEEMAAAMRSHMAQAVREEIEKKYRVSGFELGINAAPDDQRLLDASYDIRGEFNPPVDLSPGSLQQREFENYFVAARKKTTDTMRKERNTIILQTIRNHGSGLVITGKNHGIDLLLPLRREGAMDIAFSPSDKEERQAYLEGGLTTEEQKKALNWAFDEANAIQQTGKDFNPQDVVALVKQAIERANKPKPRGR